MTSASPGVVQTRWSGDLSEEIKNSEKKFPAVFVRAKMIFCQRFEPGNPDMSADTMPASRGTADAAIRISTLLSGA